MSISKRFGGKQKQNKSFLRTDVYFKEIWRHPKQENSLFLKIDTGFKEIWRHPKKENICLRKS